jgi:Bacterial SCP ortholog
MSAADRRGGDPGGAERSVAAVLAALDAGQPPPRAELRSAVRYLLDLLAARAPGRAIEVRVPPYAAVQCGEGPRHTRGTPPNVVETDPVTWMRLATGRLTWAEASGSGQVAASGVRADLSAFLPVVPPPAAR